MKLTTLLLFLAIMQVSATSLAQKVSIKASNQPLNTIFDQISSQTGFDFAYTTKTLENSKPVTINVKNEELSQVLKKIFDEQPLEYTIKDRFVTVTKKQPTTLDKIKKALTPPTDIIGRVTNEQNQPLNGATVTIKRTQTGTLTDANGNFTARNILSTDTLIISYLGYKRTFIGVGNQTNLKVVLQVATNQLDQVVIQAYGETSQRLTTGDIGTISSKDIEKQPVMNVLEALQGQITGVMVTQTSGYESAPIKVEIRGRNTMSPGETSDPLYIIDGVPLTVVEVSGNANYASGSPGFIQNNFGTPANGQSPFFSINPADIESISVLKDADATAIYGSRGANGVIIVTTKKGKAGNTHLDLTVNEGASGVPNYYSMLNTTQYLQMRREAFKNDGITPNAQNAPDLVKWDTTRNTNWQKYLWSGIGRITDVQSSLSGGNEQTTFRVGMGFTSHSDVLTVSGKNQRGSFSLGLDHKALNDRFQMHIRGSYSYAYINMIYSPANVTLPPDAPPIFDNDGNLNYAGWAPLQYKLSSFANLLNPYTSKTNFLNLSFNLSYELLKGLTISSNFGYNNALISQTTFTTIASQDPADSPTGSSSFGYNFNHNLIIEPQLNYKKVIKKGTLTALVGLTKQTLVTEGIGVSGSGYDNDALLHNITDAPVQSIQDNYGEYKYAGAFGRIGYNWEDKYILNLNARRDGSSKFGPGRQYGNFGSVGAAWIFSEEKWVKDNLPILSFGKLKGSYGTTGNDQVPSYSFLTQWAPQYNTLYSKIRPILPTGPSDSLLHWEVNRKLEISLDVGFLKDRITLEASWYRNRCNDQLVSFPTAAFTGFTSVIANSPADVQNTGLEFTLHTENVHSSSFKWITQFTIAFNRNKLLSYPDFAQSPYVSQYVIGQSLNIRRLLHSTGVDPLTGQYTFQDKNQDGKITIDYTGASPDDRTIYNMSPKYGGGFTNTFSYKNWDLSLFFTFVKQLGYSPLGALSVPGSISNEPITILQRWQKPGDIASVAEFTTQGLSKTSNQLYYGSSDAIIEDASYIRLQNLNLAYTLPKMISKKVGVSNARFFVQGENIFTLTKFNGLDPIIQGFGGLPILRRLTAGISCNF